MKRNRSTKAKVGDFFDNWDMFAQPVESINLEGQARVGTPVGFILTLLCVTTVIGFLGVRTYFFATGKRPLISTFKLELVLSETDEVDLRNENFNLAISLGG